MAHHRQWEDADMSPQLASGAPISYAVSGPTDPGTRDLVLVHGWCCDRTVMAPLQQQLERSHRVVTMDLRGHGQSQESEEDGSAGTGLRRPDQDLPPPRGSLATSIEEFAADVVAVCEAAQLRSPVVIGHSMGALVALATLAAPPVPSWQPAGAVLLDPAPIVHPKGKEYWASQVDAVRQDHAGDLRRAFARSLVLPTDRADYARVVEVMAAVHPAVAAGGARAMATFDGAAALANLPSPVLIIHAATAEGGLDRLVGDRSLLTMGRTVGAGHFHHFEVLDQLLPMVERWLDVTWPSPASTEEGVARPAGEAAPAED